MQFAASVFEIGGWAAHPGDQAPEQLGNRVARPGIGHRYPDAAGVLQRRGPWREVMVMGIDGQHGENLARAQANADIDHPDQTVGKGSLAHRQAPQLAGSVKADDGQSDHPMDDGLRTRRFVDAKGQSQETQDATDGTKADARHEKELQGQVDDVDLGQGDESVPLSLQLTQAGLGLFEGVGGAVSLGCKASDLFALVSIVVASLLGLVFPLLPTVWHFGKLAHHVCSAQRLWPEAIEWV